MCSGTLVAVVPRVLIDWTKIVSRSFSDLDEGENILIQLTLSRALVKQILIHPVSRQ
jgi:hypothetical protein